MELGELLNYKPSSVPKRPSASHSKEDESLEDDPNESYERRAAKRRRKAEADERKRAEDRMAALEAEAQNATRGSGGAHLSRSKPQDDSEDSSTADGEAMDESALKKLILNFEKKAVKNQELRVKFADDPTKFMSSEVELHDSIQDLRALATAPELYPLLVNLDCVKSFLGLLAHENTDVAVAIVDLVQELTDIDTLNESEEGAEALMDSLIQNQISALLIQNLERLNDAVREESDGIHNTLAIFENIFEFRPEMSKDSAEAGLLAWIIRKLKVKVTFDTNKLYASEILSIMLQNEPANRKTLGETPSAIDSLLQQLAYYKRHNPASPEEAEMMENIFDCLCSILLCNSNKEIFLKAEGLQLMNLMLREKKYSRNGALKVLNHALTGTSGHDLCAKFVDILGLRTIFPLLMKTPKKSKRKGVSAEEHEEHTISVVAALMKNCRGQHKERMLVKFTENDHEKVDRLCELHFKYLEKVSGADARILKENLDEDEAYLHRLDHGLFSLQLVDFIIADACAYGANGVKQRVMQILNLRNEPITTIRNVLREYAGNLGEREMTASSENAEDAESNELERQYLLHLVDKF